MLIMWMFGSLVGEDEPACASAIKAMNCADWPEDAATAATPPSRAAMRFSKTSTVGFGRCQILYLVRFGLKAL